MSPSRLVRDGANRPVMKSGSPTAGAVWAAPGSAGGAAPWVVEVAGWACAGMAQTGRPSTVGAWRKRRPGPGHWRIGPALACIVQAQTLSRKLIG